MFYHYKDSDRIITSKKFSAIAANAINSNAHNAGARRKVAMSTSTGVYAYHRGGGFKHEIITRGRVRDVE